ncbi:MAG: hypothetical protein VKK04_15865 [Synechococcales bacterium]|nr:hypothetical protein [Synechococcales bacterium]
MTDKLTIALDGDRLKESLEQQNLQEKVAVKVGFEKQYTPDALPKTLNLSVTNQSDQVIYVDWDSSAILKKGGRSRRTIRLTPYKSPDLSQAQAWSAIAPSSTLQEQITAEDALTPSKDNPEILEPAKPLIEVKGDPKDKKKDQEFKDFMAGKITLSFSMCLVIRATGAPVEANGDRLLPSGIQTYLLHCDFILKKSPWTDVVPW